MNAHNIKITGLQENVPAKLPYGTRIYLDGNELSCFSFELSGSVDEPLKATIGIYVDCADVEAEAETVVIEKSINGGGQNR